MTRRLKWVAVTGVLVTAPALATWAMAGRASSESAAAAANPEPGAVALFGLGALLVYRSLRGRTSR